ncbi:MAG: hypothetical protein QOE58_1275, partial [Actinomycetota bacterium]|nr:hypothetical protein [Actinomycetota bacterium]
FGIPARLSIIGVISVGYPAPDRKSPSLKRGRRPLSEVVSYGSMRDESADDHPAAQRADDHPADGD